MLWILFCPSIPGKAALETNGLEFTGAQGNNVEANPIALGCFSCVFALYLEVRTGLGWVKNSFALTGGRDIKGSYEGCQ